LLIYGSTAVSILAVIFFVIAQFVMRPRAFNQMTYLERVRATFIPLKNEETIFAGEIKKLKLFRTLWGTIVALVGIRVLFGLII
jgi:hypothetical protein